MLIEIIRKALNKAGVESLLADYFDPLLPFAGHTFDEGDNPPASFSARDLLAPTLLDVRIPPLAQRKLLLAGDVDKIAILPTDIDLWNATGQQMADIEAAEMWLRESKGIGSTKASKLLARKRPHLVPIMDLVVLRQLGRPGMPWTTRPLLAEALKDPEIQARLDTLAAPHEPASALRILDVVLWMQGSRSRNAKASRAKAKIT